MNVLIEHLGKLPRCAGWQPALPGKDLPTPLKSRLYLLMLLIQRGERAKEIRNKIESRSRKVRKNGVFPRGP
jgi:hypothetical protein